MSSLASQLGDRAVIVCAGTGGVGKTTTAAALGVALAADGRRVAVVTIDPARRLADILGVTGLGGAPHRVDGERFARAGLPLTGELHAMMLDARGTIDALLTELAGDAGSAAALRENPLYRRLSDAVGGTHEFAAVAALHELHDGGRFDTIVLDTPPARDALEFLDSPARLTRLLESRTLRLVLTPTGLAARLFGRQAAAVLQTLGRLTGTTLLDEIRAFLDASGVLLDAFRIRARAVEELLADERTAFLVVCSPEPAPAAEAEHVVALLADRELTFGGLVVNRVTPVATDGGPPDVDALTAALDGDRHLATSVARTVDELEARGRRDAQAVARLRSVLGDPPSAIVPELGPDAGTLDERLVAIGRLLRVTQA